MKTPYRHGLYEKIHQPEAFHKKSDDQKEKDFTLSDSQFPIFSSSTEMSQRTVISHLKGKLSDLRR